MSVAAFKDMVDALPLPALLLAGDEVVAVNDDARALLTDRETTRPIEEFLRSTSLAQKLRASSAGEATITSMGNEFVHASASRRPVVVGSLSVVVVLLSSIGTRASRDKRRDHRALDVCRIGVYEHDYVSDDFYGSPLLRQMYGFSQEEDLTLETFGSVFHPADRDRVIQEILASRDPQGDGVFNSLIRIIRPDGEVRFIQSRAQTEFGDVDGARRPLFCTGSVMDVTEAKRREAQWARSAAILDATPDLVAITDLAGKPIYANQAWRQFLQLAEDEPITIEHLRAAAPSSIRDRLEVEGLPTAIRAGSWKVETELYDAQGNAVPMSVVLIAHRGSDGSIEHLSSIARDLSREKELERRFLQAQKMEAVGRLAGGIAHDFNNMLSVITGFASLAGRNVPAGEAQKCLDEVLRAADRAGELTSQLLAFSTKQIRQPRVFSLNETVEGLEPMVARLLDESISFEFRACQPPPLIKADPNQIEQVVLNLAVNARDAMPEGGSLVVSTSHAEAQEGASSGGRWVKMSISDTGGGMDAKTMERIFEPFFSTKGPGKGTGLGLATVFGVIQQSGGDISVHSRPGEGTTFEILLPCTEEALPEERPPETQQPYQTQTAVILLVEDDSSLRSMVAMCLRQAGHSVLVASDPGNAIALAARHKDELDLLLTDVVMPHMNGKELSVRVGEAAPLAKVLFMSGYAEDAIVVRGVLERDVNFLPKPFTPERLVRAVEDILRDEG